MKCCDATVISNQQLTPTVYKMVLSMDTSDITHPGQFITIECEQLYLRRPISIYDWNDTSVTIVYRVVGKGTKVLSECKKGQVFNVLTACGNGYDINQINPDVLVGGGVGIPPLYGLAKRLKLAGKSFSVVLGYSNASEIFLLDEFKALNVPVYVSSDDGSIGIKGNVVDVLKQANLSVKSYCSCGPLVMMKALVNTYPNAIGYLSLEERMGCGFGGCMGCSIKTKNGFKRVCKEGPVFESEELLWED